MIGRLDQVITLQREARTADGGGGTERLWADLETDPRPFARVELAGGAEVAQGGRTIARQVANFTIRARADLLSSDRILWDGRAWNITGLGARAIRGAYLRIEAVAGELSR
ncbi:head-tail adaptor protein [Defluviimonas sp. D31]|uniref:head-tail adaptor protein n=1 Tax=Defluviimonas sp. D31 TaxID=3083253 RepID=UPI00296E66D1|nr:head-tail adaptor protein [Defluviimonas sp. D31]MDW4550880.1 head-tail adaptor protein [Defluviimonas sp. D31]